jgi:hypothetical protein
MNEIVKASPVSVGEVQAIQREIETAAPEMLAYRVTDDPTYAIADEALTDVVRYKDALTEMRGRATGPIYKGIREIEAWFKPVLATLTEIERHLKGTMGEWRVIRAQAEREARELAAQAAETGDADALVDSLMVASEAAAPPPGRATARMVWVIARINPDLLPDEWWCPDVAKIEAFAKACGSEKPVVPGVVFVEQAKIGAKR